MRFILNLPTSELQTSERLFFQIEQAHWYYEDFLADDPNSKLPHLNLRTFALRLFEFSELLKPLRSMYDAFFKDFMAYKGSIPTYGCIMLNEQCDKMVLVCNWKGTSWGFPKGKLNEGEDGAACAVREVEEECGYRPSIKDDDSITVVLDGGQRSKMFIVPGVPDDYPFEPLARKEISKIQFFPFDAPPKSSWNVSVFVPRLKRWVKSHRKSLKQAAKLGGSPKKNRNSAPTTNGDSANGWSAAELEPYAPPASQQGVKLSVASLFGGGGPSPPPAPGMLADSVASLFGGGGISSPRTGDSPKSVAELEQETVPPALKEGATAKSNRGLRSKARPPMPQAEGPKATVFPRSAMSRPFVFDIDDIMSAMLTVP